MINYFNELSITVLLISIIFIVLSFYFMGVIRGCIFIALALLTLYSYAIRSYGFTVLMGVISLWFLFKFFNTRSIRIEMKNSADQLVEFKALNKKASDLFAEVKAREAQMKKKYSDAFNLIESRNSDEIKTITELTEIKRKITQEPSLIPQYRYAMEHCGYASDFYHGYRNSLLLDINNINAFSNNQFNANVLQRTTDRANGKSNNLDINNDRKALENFINSGYAMAKSHLAKIRFNDRLNNYEDKLKSYNGFCREYALRKDVYLSKLNGTKKISTMDDI